MGRKRIKMEIQYSYQMKRMDPQQLLEFLLKNC